MASDTAAARCHPDVAPMSFFFGSGGAGFLAREWASRISAWVIAAEESAAAGLSSRMRCTQWDCTSVNWPPRELYARVIRTGASGWCSRRERLAR